MFLVEKLIKQLKEEEELRLTVYDDATGKQLQKGEILKGNPTIGIGRNLIGRGITESEATYLCQNDVDEVYKTLVTAWPWFEVLDDVRQRVLLDMAFNMGYTKLAEFAQTIRLIKAGKYAEASVEMLDSAWAEQVGWRSRRLAKMMRDGKDHAKNEDGI